MSGSEGLVHHVESIADRLIREAVEQGEFDQVAGSGRPIPGLSASRDPDWWAKAWLAKEAVPPRLRRFGKAIEESLEMLAGSVDELEVGDHLARLNRMISKVQNAYPDFVLPPLDVSKAIRAWRRGSMSTSYAVRPTS